MTHNSLDIKRVLLEEIALNGLEGIGLDLLWKYVGKRLQTPSTLKKLRCSCWALIIKMPDLQFYKRLRPFTRFELFDRFTLVDEVTGHLLEPEEPLDGPYEYAPEEKAYGSCADYESRELLPKDLLQKMMYEEVESTYGDHLTIVASLEQRWQAMVPHLPMTVLTQLNPLQYCLLELIARGRENGQTTVNNSNVVKIVRDAKMYFYCRLPLTKLDLIFSTYITQMTAGRSIKIQLVFIKKFYKSSFMCLPKIGKVPRLIEHLKDQPALSDSSENLLKKKLLNPKILTQLKKRHNVFKLVDKEPTADEDGVPKKRQRFQKRVTIAPISEESSESDEEKEVASLKRKYKVGVDMIRQAYQLFLDAGLKGITQLELCQLLGMDWSTIRSLCKLFITRGLLRKVFEDVGKNKSVRYIAVALNDDSDKKYEEELKKYHYYTENPVQGPDNDITKSFEIFDTEDIQSQIEEVKVINGCEGVVSETFLNPNKRPTLRQLAFANGMIEVIREQKCIIGYGYLSTIVANRIKDTPLDAKVLKRCLQRLIADKHVKVLKITWPNNPSKFVMLICSPVMEVNDPILKAKYKEICMREITEKKTSHETTVADVCQQNKYSYPRFTKMQKVHRLLIKLAYAKDGKYDTHLPTGFCTFTTLLSEMTVDLALGCMKMINTSELSNLTITDQMLKTKLSDCPAVHGMLFRSGQFKSSVKFLLKLLSLGGLMRMIRDPNLYVSEGPPTQNLPCIVYYMCRNVTIYNTKGKWPRVADLEKLKITFNLDSPEAVDTFWDTVFQISMETQVVGPRNYFKTFVNQYMDEKKAIASDKGALDGDRRGPCGFDSGFYLELRNGWQNFMVKKVPKQTVLKTAISTKKVKRIRKPRPKKSKTKSTSKKHNFFVRAAPTKTTKNEPEKEQAKKDVNSKKIIKIWSKYEDNAIVFCKAAITIMSPEGYPGSFHARNAVIKDIISLVDPKKTLVECHARALVLETDAEKCYEKECILNQLRRRTNIIEKYENLFVTLRLKYTAFKTFIKVARTRIMELVWIITQIVNSDAYKNVSPCVAVDYKEFFENFRVDYKTASNIYHTPQSKPIVGTLKEGIIMAIMHTFKDNLTAPLASQIHSAFKTYPEPILRLALEDLRKAGVITNKERNLQNKDVKSMVKYYFKIAFTYRRKFVNKYTEEFVTDTADMLRELPRDNLKASPAMNCVISELYAIGALDVVMATPSSVNAPSTSLIREEELNVLDIETKYKLKSGAIDWVAKDQDQFLPAFLLNLKVNDLRDAFKKYLLWVFPQENNPDLPDDELLSYIKEQGEHGVTFNKLLETKLYDETSLIQKLKELSATRAILSVGFNENLIIHINHIKPWTLQVNNHLVIPAPWIYMGLDINYVILLKWLGAVILRVFESPGISIGGLAEACEYLNVKNVLDLCRFLQEYFCVNLMTIYSEEPDLFSDGGSIRLEKLNEFASVKKIVVFPAVNMMSTYAYISRFLETWLAKKD